jgi:hypothetical protein
LKNILSYQDYISGSLKESLDPFVNSSIKFKIGDQVKVKDRLGKITAYDGTSYLVLIHGRNEKVKEGQIEKVGPSKKMKGKSSQKKLPIDRNLNI